MFIQLLVQDLAEFVNHSEIHWPKVVSKAPVADPVVYTEIGNISRKRRAAWRLSTENADVHLVESVMECGSLHWIPLGIVLLC